MMASQGTQSITTALIRRLVQAALVMVLASAVLHALVLHRSLRADRRDSLLAQARLCAASLAPGPRGDFSKAVAQLQARFSGLIAVSMLNSYEQLGLVYPERPAHRAVTEAAYNCQGIVRVDHPLSGEPINVVALAAPLNGDPSPGAQRALFVLRVDPPSTGLLREFVKFALALLVPAVLGIALVARWCNRRVAKPLLELASSADPVRYPVDEPLIDPGGWEETAALARQLSALREQLAESEEEVLQVEQKMVQKLHKSREGYNRQLRRAKDEAAVDPLTQLRNRSHLDTELEPLFEHARRRDVDLSAIMIDLDNFKLYNDTHGHQVGDVLLRFVGMLLRGSIRPTDHGIRYGGDEFLLLLPETDMRQAAAAAERLVKLFGQYVTRLDHPHQLSVSAGIASVAVSKVESGQALVACADNALYRAKRQGKGQIACHALHPSAPAAT